MNKGTQNQEPMVLDNRYQLEQKIGSGGMADVYKGRDLLLERPVAIKILHNNFANDEAFVHQFKGEAQSAGKLSHQHIVNMYDVGYDQGLHYIVMEYVPGQTLKDLIQRDGKLPIDLAVSIAIAIGEGLEQAHAMGIAHCDIKPHNILLTDTGAIKVTDFGIARAINSSQTLMYTTSVVGSAHYLSPEQASGKPISYASDIYSLGVVLYEMLTGRVPYQGDSPISVAIKHVRERCVPPSHYNTNIPPLLEAVVMKALEKDPQRRFHSISEMIQDLKMSYGYAGGAKSQRLAPYDFATQIMPKVQETPVRKAKAVHEEDFGGGWLDRIAKIPTKYTIGGGVLLFIIAFLAAYLSFGNFWSNATVKVPNVIGKEVSVATHILEDAHLKVLVNEVANSEVPPGRVISMTPEAGSEVKEQRIIRLVVSKGAGDISMPDLKGRSVEEAQSALQALGMTNITTELKEDPSLPDNTVISQTPSAFSKVSKDTPITLTINKKVQKTITMPRVIGLSVKDAKDILNGLQIQVQVNGNSSDSAIVSEQSPAPGKDVQTGSTVQINGGEGQEGSNAKQTSGTVDITIPAGRKNQQVKIVVVDDNGTRVVYDHRNNPGDRIVQNVSGSGSVHVQVFINGTLVQDQLL